MGLSGWILVVLLFQWNLCFDLFFHTIIKTFLVLFLEDFLIEKMTSYYLANKLTHNYYIYFFSVNMK